MPWSDFEFVAAVDRNVDDGECDDDGDDNKDVNDGEIGDDETAVMAAAVAVLDERMSLPMALSKGAEEEDGGKEVKELPWRGS